MGVRVPDLERNLATIVERSATGPFRSREAVRFEGTSLSFAQVGERSSSLAAGLAGAGVRPGDRVAVLLRNGLEWVDVLFALARLGAVCVPVNVLLRPSEIQHVCEDAEVAAFIADEAGVEAFEALECRPPLVIGVGDARPANPGGREVAFDDLSRGGRFGGWPPPAPTAPLVLYYSSGTTGLPKAAVHTHDNVLWNSFHQVPDLGVTRDDVYLVVPSLSWAAGFHDVMLAAMWVGGRSVILPTGGTTIDRVAAAARDARATKALLVPTLLKQLLEDRESQELLRSSPLRFVLTGAEPVPRPVIDAFNEALPECRLVQGYGLSEFPTVASILQADEAVSRAGSAGRPTSITRMAVLDGDGEVAAEGEGEVLLQSLATMVEYWRRPEETAEAFAGGWLHTGDVGVLDDEGYLTITGRKKDMIISGGLNVYPSEVETVIYAYPGVREAAVVGLADERWGEVPIAVVVADTDLDVVALEAHCRDHLAGYKRPRRVLVRAEPLPRNPSGKVLKRELRPWVASHDDDAP